MDNGLHANHGSDGVCKCKSSSAAQTFDEMDFERGIWTAGNQ